MADAHVEVGDADHPVRGHPAADRGAGAVGGLALDVLVDELVQQLGRLGELGPSRVAVSSLSAVATMRASSLRRATGLCQSMSGLVSLR